MKLCAKCGEVKSLDQFPRHHRGGLLNACRSCEIERQRERRRREAAGGVVITEIPFDEDPAANDKRAEGQVWHLPPPDDLERYVAEKAACRGLEGWFDYNFRNHAEIEHRKDICSTCPVLEECRTVCERIERGISPRVDGYVSSQCLAGIWAGETPVEREIRRRQELGIPLRPGRGAPQRLRPLVA